MIPKEYLKESDLINEFKYMQYLSSEILDSVEEYRQWKEMQFIQYVSKDIYLSKNGGKSSGAMMDYSSIVDKELNDLSENEILEFAKSFQLKQIESNKSIQFE